MLEQRSTAGADLIQSDMQQCCQQVAMQNVVILLKPPELTGTGFVS
jgi:hypothetical protein